MSDFMGLVVSYGYIWLLLVTAPFIARYNKEYARKYVHILAANWWLIAMWFFVPTSVFTWLIPATFVIVNYITYKFHIFKAIETDEDRGRGTIYYAISLFILAVITFPILQFPIIGAFGVLIMGYGDGLSALVGQKVRSRKWLGNKSIAGTTIMFAVSATISILLFQTIGYTHWLLASLVVAVVATVAETFGIKGRDNLLVPLISSLVAAIFIYLI